MAITCNLGNEQLKVLYAVVYKNMVTTPEGQAFDVRALMSRLYTTLKERQGEAAAVEYMQAVPYMAGILSFRTDVEISKDTDLRQMARTLMDPETGYNETLRLVSGGLTPQQLSIIALEEEDSSEDLEAPPLVPRPNVKDTDDYKPDSAFTSTFEEFITVKPEEKTASFVEQIDVDKSYIYKTLQKLKAEHARRSFEMEEFTNDFMFQGKNLRLKTLILNNISVNDRTEYSNNFVLRANSIKNPDPNVKKPTEIVTLVVTDEKGNYVYFDNNGNVSTKEAGGRIVYQMMRDARKSGSQYRVTDIYGKKDQIQTPEQIAKGMLKLMGGLTEAEFEESENKSYSDFVKEIAEEQQKSFKELYDLRESVVKDKKTYLLPISSISPGVKIELNKNADNTTLSNLSSIYPESVNEIYSSLIVLPSAAKGFEAGAAVVTIDGENYKVDRSDITEDLAKKIAKALTSKTLTSQDKYKYYSQFFIDKGFYGLKRHYLAFQKGQLLFTYDPYTVQEVRANKTLEASNKRTPLDFNSATAEEDIYNILMSGKSSAKGVKYPAKITYNDTLIGQDNYLDFADGKLVPANYTEFLKTLPGQIYINGDKSVPFFNSYMRFRMPNQVNESLDKSIQKVKEQEEKKSEVRNSKDYLVNAIKKAANKSIEVNTIGNSSYGITPDGKPYANFKIKNPVKEGQALKVYLTQKEPTTEFPFPKNGQKVLLEVNDISVDGKVITDVVQAFDYTDGKKGMLLGQLSETDHSAGEQERVYTTESGDVEQEAPRETPPTNEDIKNVIDNPDESQPSDDTPLSDLFDLSRTTALPKGITESKIKDIKDWWSTHPMKDVIDLAHLANIVNSDAYAKFIVNGNILATPGKLARIEIYKNGSFADLYHEAWHGFSQLYLTRDEKIKLYNEVIKNDPSLANATFFQIEEKLAEDFRTYALNQKTKKGAPVRNSLFRRIWNFIKKLFGSPTVADVSPNQVEQNAMVTELFNKLYLASSNPSLLNSYTPSVDNVMFDLLNRGVENVNFKKEDALNRQDANAVSESIDSALSELIDNVNTEGNRFGKAATLKLLSGDRNKKAAYEEVRKMFEKNLANLRENLGYKPLTQFDNLKTLENLEDNAVAIMRNAEGKNQYVFLKSQVNDYSDLNLNTKQGIRQKGNLYKESVEIISDFYIHDTIKNEAGEPADILIVTNLAEAKNQFNNYIKGKDTTYTSLDVNEDVVDAIPEIKSADSETLDAIRILQTALKNWGNSESGVVKYHTENSRYDIVRQKFDDLDADATAQNNANKAEKALDKKAGDSSLLEMADSEIVYLLKSLFKVDKKGKTTNNKLGFKELGNFSQTWKNMVRTLNGITDPSKMYEAIQKASGTFPEFEQLIKKLPNPNLPNNSTETDITTSLWQTFQKPEATLLQLTGFRQDDGSIVTELTNASADVSGILYQFRNKFKSDTRGSYIEKVNNESVLNLTALVANFSDSNGNLDPDKNFKFLTAMGFYFDDIKVIKNEINGLQANKKYSVNYIFDTVKAISYTEKSGNISKKAADLIAEFKKDPLAVLNKGIPPHTVGSPNGFVYKSGSKQKSAIDKLLGLQVRYGADASNFTALNPERNLVNRHIEHSSASMIIDGFNKANKFEDLWTESSLKYMDSFNPKKNPFVEELQIVKTLFDFTTTDKKKRSGRSIELDLMMGTQIAEFTIFNDKGEAITKRIGTNTAALDMYGKFLQELHTFMKGGSQEFLRAGSKSTAMGLRVNGGIVSEVGERGDSRYYIDLDKFLPGGQAEDFAFDNIILPYLSGETERINRFKNSEQAKNYVGYNIKRKDGKMQGESFMYFDFLDSTTKDKILEKVNQPGVKLKDYIKNDPDLYKDIKQQVVKFFNENAEEAYEYLQKTKYIDKTLMDRLNVANISEAEKERVLTKAYIYNAWIHNFEVSQLIFGDIAQFKHSKEEFHKRTSGAISGGPKIRTDKAAQDFINDVSIDDKNKDFAWERNLYAKTLNDDKYVKFTYRGTVNTAIIKDIDRDSIYIPFIEKAIRADYEKRYSGKNIPQSVIDDRIKTEVDKYRGMTEGDGQGYITFDAYRNLKKLMKKWGPEQEALFRKIANGEEVSKDAITEFFPVFKLQNYGNLANDTVLPVTAMHKFALVPLIPSMIKGMELETLHKEMLRNNIQYATFASGSKVGAITSDGKPDNIFTDDTQTAIKTTFDLTPNTVHVEFLKESASVPSHYKGKTVFATQLRKIILAGLYQNGELVNADNKSVADRYIKAVDNYTNLLKLELLNEINFKQVGDTYKGNLENLLKLVQRELRRKDMPEHLVEAIGLNPDGTLKNDLSIHLDAQTIEKTIMSLVEKRFVKQKLKGEALVQVASSFTNGSWTQSPKLRTATEEERLKYLGSNSLPFYYPGENGKTNAMKIAVSLQGDFNNLLNQEWKGEKIGTISRLNDLIKDDEWLNTGDNRKSVTLTAVRIPVQGLNSMEFMEVWEFLDPASGNLIIPPSEIVAKSGSDFDVDKLTTFFPHISTTGEYITSKESTDEFIKRVEKERNESDKNFEGQIKKQKSAAENELIDSIRGVLEIPDNYVNLVRPNDTYILEDIANELENFVSDYDRFRGGSKEAKQISPSMVLNPLYNVHKHGVNMEGKDVLGIAANENAIGPVLDSIGAKMPLSYYPSKFSKKLNREVEDKKKKKRNMRLLLSHNTTPEGNISLSNIYSKDGTNSIAELFSQAINGTVDVEKNPWIFFIQGNMETANVLFYLFKAGVPVKDAIYFVSNPLVREYVQNQKSLKSAYSEFTGVAPEKSVYAAYQAAATVINDNAEKFVLNSLGNDVSEVAVLEKNNQEPYLIKANILAEKIRNGEINAADIESINKTKGSPYSRGVYQKPVLTNEQYYKTAVFASSKMGVLKGKVFDTKDMEDIIKVPGKQYSPTALAMFTHFIEIEKQIKGLGAAKRNAKPDTQTFKSPQEILYRDINTDLLSENSKVDDNLMTKLETDSVLSSLFDKKIIMSMLKPLFQLRDNPKLNNYILAKARLAAGDISAKYGPGKDGISRFFDEYKNGVINFIYQNYLSNLIDSEGKITNKPTDYRGYKIVVDNTQGYDVVINKDSEGVITSISVNYDLIDYDFKNKTYLGSNNALPNSYAKRGMKTFRDGDRYFPEKSLFTKFVLEREYLREMYENEVPEAQLENYIADRALMNTFNPAVIGRQTEHSYSDKIMGIIKNFPSLKEKFPILEQLSIAPNAKGDYIITLNDRGLIGAAEAEIYTQNIKQLADPNIEKVENNPIANKAISDVFSLFPQMMIYQHGVGKSKFGFNIAMPSDKYNTIMKYASQIFENNYIDNATFEVIYDRLMTAPANFKNYFVDADVLSKAPEPSLEPLTDDELELVDEEELTQPTEVTETTETDLSIEDKKANLKRQIEALPDNMIYGAHVTGDEVAKQIYDSQFNFNLGTSLNGTVGLTNKQGLLDLMNNLLDGKSPHRNQFGVFILAFPKSEFGETSAERKVNLDTIESDMLDNYPEFVQGKIPTKFNFGYFKDGVLVTKTNLPPADTQLDLFGTFDESSETLRKQQEEDDRKEDEEENNCTDSPFLDE